MIATMTDAKSIFTKALELDGTREQAAFLDSACEGNPELRAEIESLLQAQREAGNFLELDQAATQASTRHESPSETPGTAIGPYRLLEQIGEGGMGTVYVAQQTEPVKRLVALKIIKPGMDSRQVIARFEAERQALALMDHPHIAKVLDAGTTDDTPHSAGRPYFVMELVKGVPITRFCDERKLPLRARLELFARVCQAVQHAHAKGIIHRDLKPTNVLVALHDDRAVPTVIDFGVAKATGEKLTEETLHTGWGAVVGTPEYMSPEQASLQLFDIDTRSDIYSLGVLLYELLTGSPPFSRENVDRLGLLEIFRVIREEEPAPPSARLSSSDRLSELSAFRGTEPARLAKLIRGDLDWIVLKALEKDRDRRYATANDLAQDIQRFLADEPVQASPPSAVYRLRKFVRRNRVAVGAVLAVAAALLIGTIVATWQAVRATRAERAEAKLLEGVQEEKDKAVDAANELKAALARETFVSYVYRIALAQREWGANEVGRARQLLDECPAVLRDWEWRYVRRLCNTATLTYPGHQENVRQVEFSPNGRHAASIGKTELRVWNTSTGEDVFQVAGTGGVGVAFSRDGTQLAAAWAQSVTIHDAASGEEQFRIDAGIAPTERFPFPASLSSVAFSPDGQQIAMSGTLAKVGGPHGYSGGVVKVWELAGGKTIHSFENLSTSALQVCFSPNGQWLAAGTYGAGGELPEPGEIYVWNAATGKQEHRFLAQPEVTPGEDSCSVLSLAFKPDNTRLVSAHSDGQLRIWRFARPEPPLVLRGHQGWVGSVAYSANGDRLASIGQDRIVRLWNAATGLELSTFRGHTQSGQAVAFRSDGQQIASAAGHEIRLWNVAGQQEARTFYRSPPPGDYGVYDVAFSPDSKLLASASMDKIEFRDVETGAELPSTARIHPSAMGDYARVAFSPSGDVVATIGIHGVKLWDIKTGAEVRLFPDHPEIANPPYTCTVALAFRPDGERIATTGRNLLTIWETKTGKLLHKIPFHDEKLVVGSIAYSPDGRKIATATHPQTYIPAEIRLWDAETGKELLRIAGGGPGIRFNHDGTRLAASHAGNTVGIWDAASGELLLTLKGHSGPVTRLAFSPGGRRLATASADQTIKLWDPENGQEVLTLRGHDARVVSVAFSPDGRYLASSADVKPGQVKLWDAGVAEE